MSEGGIWESWISLVHVHVHTYTCTCRSHFSGVISRSVIVPAPMNSWSPDLRKMLMKLTAAVHQQNNWPPSSLQTHTRVHSPVPVPDRETQAPVPIPTAQFLYWQLKASPPIYMYIHAHWTIHCSTQCPLSRVLGIHMYMHSRPRAKYVHMHMHTCIFLMRPARACN